MKLITLAATALAAALAASGALAQATTAWRCGADGRSYSDTPCPGGLAVAGDSRNAEQLAAAREVAVRERRLADHLVAEREQRDRQAATRLGPRATVAHAAVKPKALPRKAKKPAPADDGIWRAVVPASPRGRG